MLWAFHIWPLLCWGMFFFVIKGCWILSKVFSASIEMVLWFLSFNLLIWCITLIDLWILKNPCIPGKTRLDHGVWVFNVLNYICQNFVDDFCIYVHQWYWPVSFFFHVVFALFWYPGDCGLVEWIWKCSFLSVFGKSFRKTIVSSSLNVC